ncbi:MAG: insulinase family protein [Candidatus Schekmanbacteria bacterium]|nr:insulinase family protein [Candidatus Schekmanbacteria bacterium]
MKFSHGWDCRPVFGRVTSVRPAPSDLLAVSPHANAVLGRLLTLVFAGVLAALYMGATAAASPRAVSQHDVPKLARRVLANGVRACAIEDPRLGEFVDVAVHVAVGSADEQRREAGLAHLLEHLVISATVLRDGSTLDAWLRSRGMFFNGATGLHATTYFVRGVRDTELSDLLDALAQAVLSPSFDSFERFAMERLVVGEEVRIGLGAHLPDAAYRGGRASEVLLTRLFGQAPPSWGPSGFAQTVADTEPAAAAAFHDRHYVPEATTVIVASGLASDAVHARVAGAFAGVPRRQDSAVLAPIAQALTVPAAFSVVPVPIEAQDQVGAWLGFVGPPPASAAGVHLHLLLEVLGHRFTKNKDRRFKLETGPYFPGRHAKSSAVLLGATLASSAGFAAFDALESALVTVIEDARSAPPTAAELDVARRNLGSEERNSGLSVAATTLLVEVPLEAFADVYRWRSQATPEDLLNVARTVLNLDHAVLAVQGQGRHLWELRAVLSTTLFVAGALLPGLLVLAVHVSLRRWLDEGAATLYLVRPVSRGKLVAARLAAAVGLSAVPIATVLAVVHLSFSAVVRANPWRLWLAMPALLLILACVLGLHAGFFLLTRRSGIALALTAVSFLGGNASLQAQELYQRLAHDLVGQAGLRALYRALPKYDQIRSAAAAFVLGADPGSILTADAVVHLVALTAAVVAAGIGSFSRLEIRSI